MKSEGNGFSNKKKCRAGLDFVHDQMVGWLWLAIEGFHHRYHIKARCLVRAAGQWRSMSARGGHLATVDSLTRLMVHIRLNNHNLLNFLPIFKRFGSL